MSLARSDDELMSAVESMFRIRAVESPPDASGERTIWHKGTRGAELVSWVDGAGLVIRQEFSLFEDVIVWERGRGFSTGKAKRERENVSHGAQRLDFDVALNLERIDRVARGMTGYKGNDRLIGHVREQLKTRGELSTMEPEAVTRPGIVVRAHFEAASSRENPVPQSSKVPVVAIAVGIVLIIAAGALLFMK